MWCVACRSSHALLAQRIPRKTQGEREPCGTPGRAGNQKLVQGRTLLSLALSCALGSSLTFGVQKDQLRRSRLSFPFSCHFLLNLFLQCFELVKFSDLCIYIVGKYINN